jgi:hypothetical protein
MAIRSLKTGVFSRSLLVGNAGFNVPYATGGTVTSDATYWYHTFTSSGTFTPTKALTADYLVVAGGGGGGGRRGAGGGAGGLLNFASQSVSTAQTITIGAGGTGGTGGATGYPQPTKGIDSQLGSLTLVKGGGAGDGATVQDAPLKNGGSGGGSVDGLTAGSATSGQGYGGGIGSASATNYGAGGGGGAGAVGGAGSSTAGGVGGAGLNTY